MNRKKQILVAILLIVAGIVFLAISAYGKAEMGYTNPRRMTGTGFLALFGGALIALGVYGIYKLKKGEEPLFWKALWNLIAKNDDKALYKALDIEEQWEEKQREAERDKEIL